jgi:hypothetical protein
MFPEFGIMTISLAKLLWDTEEIDIEAKYMMTS